MILRKDTMPSKADRQRAIKVGQVPHRTAGRDSHPAILGSFHRRHLAIHAIGGQEHAAALAVVAVQVEENDRLAADPKPRRRKGNTNDFLVGSRI